MVGKNSLAVDSAPAQDYTHKDAERTRTADEFTSSRTANWWYPAIHNITAMVGAGVLSLPYTMVFLGWGPGILVHVLSWLVTLFTLWQLVEMHEIVPGKRFDRYHELAQHAFGEKVGLWILVPPNLMVEVGVNIVYMVTGGQSLKKFHETVCGSCKPLRQSYWILIFSSIHYLLALLPNLSSVAGISMAAALMSLRKPDWLIAVANMMVGIHVIGSYQVFAMPVYDGLERVLVNKFKLPPGRYLRLIARYSYVAFTTFIAVTFPFFGDLLGFFGGLAFTPTSYFLPSMMWLAICKPKRFSLCWLLNWFCILFGFIIMVVSTIGGFRSLLTDAYTYRFYQ